MLKTTLKEKQRALASAAGEFQRSKGGAVMMTFGLAVIPVMLALGVGIDLSRLAAAKSTLQASSDAAVLMAGAQPTLTQAQRQTLATGAIAANLLSTATSSTSIASTKNIQNLTVTEMEPSAGVYQVKVTATVPTTIMKIAGFSTMSVRVYSQAQTTSVGSNHPLEMALALDNTGSMAPNISALITAANTLASTVFSAGGGSNVRVSVVPYVAAVNPGLTSLSYVDTTAQSPYNGIWMRYAWIAYGGCKVGGAPYWGPPSSGGGGGSSGPGGSSTGDAGDARDILDILEPIRHMAQELLGVRSAHASSTGVTPNTVPPIVTTTQGGLKVPSGFIFVPDGSGYSTGECEWLSNPATVSHYDLFPRTLNTAGQAVAWKGCVEARPTAAELTTLNSWWGSSYATSTDWDVTDTPPGSDPNSLFVPYFWPDEPDYNMVTWNYMAPSLYASGSGGFHNNYINDGYYASGSTTEALSPAWGNGWTLSGWWGAGQFILKYDGTTNSAAWNETGPTTAGPNAGCPEPLTPLTNNQQTVTNAINAMNYWYNGGTIISEGFMWAWRTLSPNSPYFPTANTGMAYGSGSNKVIVLMTDGVNGLADNGDSNSSGTSSANISDYSAYGYLGGYRLGSVDNISQYGPVSNPTNPPTDLTTYFDNRLLAACTNAKAKGITVYTVLFSANISASLATHSQSILQQCASTPSNAYSAANATALNAAFATIATNAVAAPLHLANYTGSP